MLSLGVLHPTLLGQPPFPAVLQFTLQGIPEGGDGGADLIPFGFGDPPFRQPGSPLEESEGEVEADRIVVVPLGKVFHPIPLVIVLPHQGEGRKEGGPGLFDLQIPYPKPGRESLQEGVPLPEGPRKPLPAQRRVRIGKLPGEENLLVDPHAQERLEEVLSLHDSRLPSDPLPLQLIHPILRPKKVKPLDGSLFETFLHDSVDVFRVLKRPVDDVEALTGQDDTVEGRLCSGPDLILLGLDHQFGDLFRLPGAFPGAENPPPREEGLNCLKGKLVLAGKVDLHPLGGFPWDERGELHLHHLLLDDIGEGGVHRRKEGRKRGRLEPRRLFSPRPLLKEFGVPFHRHFQSLGQIHGFLAEEGKGEKECEEKNRGADHCYLLKSPSSRAE